MISPSAVRGPETVASFRPALADPLEWGREVTLGLTSACAGAVTATLLTLGLTSLGLREDPAMIAAFGLASGLIAVLGLALRRSQRFRPSPTRPSPRESAGPEATAPATRPRERPGLGGLRSREFAVIIVRDPDGFYMAFVPVLPGCHTQARSRDELSERIKEAIEQYLKVEGEVPEPLDFVGIQRVTVHHLA